MNNYNNFKKNTGKSTEIQQMERNGMQAKEDASQPDTSPRNQEDLRKLLMLKILDLDLQEIA